MVVGSSVHHSPWYNGSLVEMLELNWQAAGGSWNWGGVHEPMSGFLSEMLPKNEVTGESVHRAKMRVLAETLEKTLKEGGWWERAVTDKAYGRSSPRRETGWGNNEWELNWHGIWHLGQWRKSASGLKIAGAELRWCLEDVTLDLVHNEFWWDAGVVRWTNRIACHIPFFLHRTNKLLLH